MKKFIGVLVLIFLFGALNAQIQKTINLRFGDSESKGLAGIEFVLSKVSIAGGWRPAWMPAPADKAIHSFDVALTVYTNEWYESSFYISLARASKSIIYVSKIDANTGEDTYKVEPSVIFQVGRRFNFKDMSPELNSKFSLDAGIGANFGNHATLFAFEFILNYSLGRRHYK